MKLCFLASAGSCPFFACLPAVDVGLDLHPTATKSSISYNKRYVDYTTTTHTASTTPHRTTPTTPLAHDTPGRIYITANSGARIGMAESLKKRFKVAWADPSDPTLGYR